MSTDSEPPSSQSESESASSEAPSWRKDSTADSSGDESSGQGGSRVSQSLPPAGAASAGRAQKRALDTDGAPVHSPASGGKRQRKTPAAASGGGAAASTPAARAAAKKAAAGKPKLTPAQQKKADAAQKKTDAAAAADAYGRAHRTRRFATVVISVNYMIGLLSNEGMKELKAHVKEDCGKAPGSVLGPLTLTGVRGRGGAAAVAKADDIVDGVRLSCSYAHLPDGGAGAAAGSAGYGRRPAPSWRDGGYRVFRHIGALAQPATDHERRWLGVVRRVHVAVQFECTVCLQPGEGLTQLKAAVHRVTGRGEYGEVGELTVEGEEGDGAPRAAHKFDVVEGARFSGTYERGWEPGCVNATARPPCRTVLAPWCKPHLTGRYAAR